MDKQCQDFGRTKKPDRVGSARLTTEHRQDKTEQRRSRQCGKRLLDHVGGQVGHIALTNGLQYGVFEAGRASPDLSVLAHALRWA